MYLILPFAGFCERNFGDGEANLLLASNGESSGERRFDQTLFESEVQKKTHICK